MQNVLQELWIVYVLVNAIRRLLRDR